MSTICKPIRKISFNKNKALADTEKSKRKEKREKRKNYSPLINNHHKHLFTTMSAYKQAGISLNKAFAIAAQTLRNSLKPEFKAAAERRGVVEAKVAVYENVKAGEPRELKPIDK